MRVRRFQYVSSSRCPSTTSVRSDIGMRLCIMITSLCLVLSLVTTPLGYAYAQPAIPSAEPAAPVEESVASYLFSIEAEQTDGATHLILHKNIQLDSPLLHPIDAVVALCEKEHITCQIANEQITSISNDLYTYANYRDEQGEGAWHLFVNKTEVTNNQMMLVSGDHLELKFIRTVGTGDRVNPDQPVLPEEPVNPLPPTNPSFPVDPGAARPNYEASWPEFAPNTEHVGSEHTPTTAATTELAWKHHIDTHITPKEGESVSAMLSDALEVNGKLYSAYTVATMSAPSWSPQPHTSKLRISNITTGEVLKEIDLPDGIDSTSRPVYYQGLIIVPLLHAQIAAFTADNLTCVWITPKRSGEGGDEKLLSSLHVLNNTLVASTTSGWGDAPGSLLGIDPLTGKILWEQSNAHGYYWSGAALVGKHALIAGDDGRLQSFDPATGTVYAAASLQAGVRSQITPIPHSSDVLVNTKTGTLERYHIDAQGNIAKIASNTYGSYSTSTPQVVGDKVVVFGGGVSSSDNKSIGYLYLFNLNDLSLVTKVETSYPGTDESGKAITINAISQSTPLVVTDKDQTYIYFTCNTKPGGLLAYRMGDTKIGMIYTPEAAEHNYTISSPMLLSNGYISYINDSGTRYTLRAKVGIIDPIAPPQPPINPPIDPVPINPPVDPPSPVNPPVPTNPIQPNNPDVGPSPTAGSEQSAHPAHDTSTETTDEHQATEVALENSEMGPRADAKESSTSSTKNDQSTEVANSNSLNDQGAQALWSDPDQAPMQTKSLLGSHILWGSLILAGLSLLGLFFVLAVGRPSH